MEELGGKVVSRDVYVRRMVEELEYKPASEVTFGEMLLAELYANLSLRTDSVEAYRLSKKYAYAFLYQLAEDRAEGEGHG